MWNVEQRVDFRPESSRVAGIGQNGLEPVVSVLLMRGRMKHSCVSATRVTIFIILVSMAVSDRH